MLKRTLSTLALWVIVLAALHYFGAVGGVWLITIASLLTLREFYAMVARTGIRPFDRSGMALGAAITLGPLYLDAWAGPAELLALAVVVFSIRMLGEPEAQHRMDALAWSVLGVIYVPFMLHFLTRIILIETPHPNAGLVMTLWLVAVSKFCDTGALLTGMAFGRHRMAPQISPKKTWEGFAGGLLTAALIGAFIAHVARDFLPAGFSPWLAAVIALPIAGVAVVSDLVESIMKRRAAVKDSGATIPGIGGVFDLTDSLILAAPLGYAVFHGFTR
ncbi:MAG: phosphatidate cytidylyltransferase [Opitutaceae bacterium]|nr:phosphatidate cytidylyltransferase [Opitutaceae bacterium]